MDSTPENTSIDEPVVAPAGQIPRDEAVAQQIEEIPAAEGAVVLENLPYAEAAEVAEYLDPDTAGRILAEMDPQAAAHVLDGMEAPEASMVVASMDPDDRVDILEHVSDTVHEAIVKELDPEDRADVALLEQYPPDSAGGIMTTQVTSLPEEYTVEQAISELRRLHEQYEQMFYAYVVDRRRHLIGVLSMRDLILSKPDRRISQIMHTEVARVPTHMDQEHVARLMRRDNYLAVPVVDDFNRLVGIITADDIVDVIQEEATEDLQKMFGAGAEERLSSPLKYSFRHRIGWLEVNLLTAIVAAWVISHFGATIQQLPMLAAFIALVAAVSGTAGAQSLSVAIRGIAISERKRGALWSALRREAMLGLLCGALVGLTLLIPAGLGLFGRMSQNYNAWGLAAVVAIALTINHVIACVTGVLIPYVMRQLRVDPVQSAAIWSTTVADCCSFLVTLGIARLCLGWLLR